MKRTFTSRPRGVSLVEALVALAVMAFGMLTVVGVQSTLRFNADVAKQRTEAMQIAQAQLESDRAFTQVDGVSSSWSAIASDAVEREVAGLNAVYRVKRAVAADAHPIKTMSVTVSWNDRAGQSQEVKLNSSIAAALPALSGALAVRQTLASGAPVRRSFKRHPSIPVRARDMGSSSVFVPPSRPTMLIVFNNATGAVTGVCDLNYGTETDNISNTEVASCNNTVNGQLVSGFVRFQPLAEGPDLTAAQVEDPQGPALNMRMTLTLTSSNHPSGSFCIDDANFATVFNGALPFATYFCVIMSNTEGLWSGTTEITPRNDFTGQSWQISDDDSGTGTNANSRYRVCRYTPAANDSVSIPNESHPRTYTNVSGNLTDQNFVVIRSTKHCPTDVAANPTTGDFVNSNTLQHQPAPN